jgi:hypothetical protein
VARRLGHRGLFLEPAPAALEAEGEAEMLDLVDQLVVRLAAQVAAVGAVLVVAALGRHLDC